MNQGRDQYSQEEAYFYKINKELLERKRSELDAKKNEKSAQANNPNWMMCPKCGDDMEEIELMRIKVDKCVQCQGIYFNNGELQILLESQEPKGFLGMLRKVF
ncbi:MAG: hypothetical protein A2Z20_07355 [Bdellovibrionales bacterium RBG_16_40_8]|nr:MAG: hypothetical protein A2Z20_07355 [Bdellovibrionales bacterium RBG_16_40_8]